MIDKFCIFRTYSAGVHCGYLKQITGKLALVAEARRIWRWQGAFSLNEVATEGCAESSRISAAVPSILLTEVIEVIQCSETAAANLKRTRNN
jgi:hypothetical protein